MALIELNVYSEALGMQTQVLVIMPQKSTLGQIGITAKAEDAAYKCLYLLHGLSDDQTIWLRRTSIERYASEYGICVVMPRADRSFYCDTAYGASYYTYIAKELPMRMQEFFHVSGKREDNFIAGLSMGGYGALKIALRENQTFCAGAGLSPVADLQASCFDDLLRVIFGSDRVPEQDDLLCLAEQQKNASQKPRLYMAVGKEDFLYDCCQTLRRKLENNYDFTYYEEDNIGHSWVFWDAQIIEVLKWMFDNKR